VSFDPVLEQIRLYARQLRLPSFSRYPDILGNTGVRPTHLTKWPAWLRQKITYLLAT